MARKDFDAPDSIANAIPHTIRRHRCFAENCPMPGTITPGGSGSATCAWHYGVLSTDIPKVTRVLLDWQCVAFELNEARRVLTATETACDVKAQSDLFAGAWERLRSQVSGWEDQLRPGNVHSSKGVDRGFPEGYGDWAKRLERFIGARVVEVLSIRQRAAA